MKHNQLNKVLAVTLLTSGLVMTGPVLAGSGVLGIFRPKTTKNAEAPAPQSLQEGITFS